MKKLLLTLLVLISVSLLWLALTRPKDKSVDVDLGDSGARVRIPASNSWESTPWQERLASPPARSSPPLNNDARFYYRPDGYSEYRDAITTAESVASAPDAPTHLEQVEVLFSQYYWAFKQVPVGSENSEITQQLLGDNDKFLIFIAHDSSIINAAGELLDYWGTPYFFHPVSEKLMEIRSAGPDQRLWTSDDLAPAAN